MEVAVLEAAVLGLEHDERGQGVEVEELGGLEGAAAEEDDGEREQVCE